MVIFGRGEYRPYFIGALLVLLMAIALILRMIPALFIPSQGFLLNSGADVWYTMRQVEVMVAHFPQYNWFDPMTAFPVGKTIDWGPLYPFLGAALSIIVGASSRADIVNITGWIAPLMATILIPVTYLLGKMIWDWKAGLAAAGFVSVISFISFTYSSFGWMDHHTTEVFFTVLFFLAYLAALDYTRHQPVILSDPKTFCIPVLLSCLCGFFYFLGYLTAPTIIIVLLIVAIFTLFQSISDYAADRPSGYLILVNCLSFACIAVLEILFGFLPWAGLSLISYSVGHVYVLLGLIAETVFLSGMARIFRRSRLQYFLFLAIVVISGFILLYVFPALQSIGDQAYSLIWGSSAYTIAIKETQAWTFSAAYETFGLALILMAGGAVILTYSAVKRQQNGQIFLLVWLAVTVLLTIPHQRFQMYMTVPVALTAAICTAEVVRWSWGDVKSVLLSRVSDITSRNNPENTKGGVDKKGLKAKRGSREFSLAKALPVVKCLTFAGIVIIAILVFTTSAAQDYTYVANTPNNLIPGDWVETMDWVKTSTPPTGVDYFKTYDQKTFVYPGTAYGILAPWEEGHRITFFAQRLPIMNPFQNNLAGNDGGASFYLSDNESRANTILSNFKGRYVITDLGTATDTFPSLIPWVNGSDSFTPYIYWAFVQDSSGDLTKTHLLGDAYYQTMIVRLQVFDGSLVNPGTAQYTTYTIKSVPDSGNTAGVGGLARIITGMQKTSVSDDNTRISPEGTVLHAGDSYADFYSSAPYEPVRKVPALSHYRLVHESPTNISVQLFGNAQGSSLPDIRLVKVFEYVKGAHIPGEGVIELNLVTNTGRAFVYRQESSQGEFIVPYATEGGTTEVRATGPYHIAGTSRSVSVTEADVLNGNTVS